MPTPEGPARPASRWRRYARLSLKLALVLLVSALLLEGGLRVLLFSDNARIAKLAVRLRSPDNFAHRWSSEYWKLQYLFSAEETRKPPPNVDAVLGWRSKRLSQVGYRHAQIATLAGARPVLLYGDSFAERTSWEPTWDSLLAASPRGQGLALLNYGVGGYGFDQAFLSYMLTIDTVAALDPVVVMSVLIDDDLDRIHLDFRGWPKPFLDLDAKELDFANDLGPDSDDWLAAHPPEIRSYLWRYLLFGSQALSAETRNRVGGRQQAWSDTRRATRRILTKLDRELRGRKLQSFVLIFHGKSQLEKPEGGDWREEFLLRELDRLGLPYVSTRTDIEADSASSGRALVEYVAERGKHRGHYTPLGNQVSFGALERGLAGQFDGSASDSRRDPQRP